MNKSEAFSKFREWKKLVENQINKKVGCLRTDNGLEFCNSEFNGFCKSEGIERHITCAYTPEQNGVAERMNRTIMEKVRCLLDESGLGEEFWEEVVSTAVYLINRSPASAIDNEIPEELWIGRKPSYNHLRRFGSVAYIHTDQGKLKPRAIKGIFTGYANGTKGYRVWLLDEERFAISRNVVFTEDVVFKDLKKETAAEDVSGDHVLVQHEIVLETGAGMDEVSGGVNPQTEEGSGDLGSGDLESESEQEEVQRSYRLARDRPRRQIVPPSRFNDFEVIAAFALVAAEDVVATEPSSYQEAMDSSESDLWNGSMEEEMDSLKKNELWNLVK